MKPAHAEDTGAGLHLVITDFNGHDQTQRCLQALRTSHYQDFSILIVDHGTDGRTREMLAREHPEVIRVEGSPDLWWTGATNLGIRAALERGASHVMLLNNDCYVLPETIGTLLRLAQEHPDAIIAPIQRDWRSGKITSISPRSRFLLGFPTVPGPRRLTPAMAAQPLLPVKLIGGGRGVILSAGVLADLGLFDEEALPHYWADHDFYLRARCQGVPLRVATGAFVDIDNTRTTSADRPETLNWSAFLHTLCDTRSHRNVRDVAALFRKHYPIRSLYPLGVALYLSRYLVAYLFKRAHLLWRGKDGKAKHSLRGDASRTVPARHQKSLRSVKNRGD